MESTSLSLSEAPTHYKYTGLGYSSAVKCLPSVHKKPGFDPQLYKTKIYGQAWKNIPAITIKREKDLFKLKAMQVYTVNPKQPEIQIKTLQNKTP